MLYQISDYRTHLSNAQKKQRNIRRLQTLRSILLTPSWSPFTTISTMLALSMIAVGASSIPLSSVTTWCRGSFQAPNKMSISCRRTIAYTTTIKELHYIFWYTAAILVVYVAFTPKISMCYYILWNNFVGGTCYRNTKFRHWSVVWLKDTK